MAHRISDLEITNPSLVNEIVGNRTDQELADSIDDVYTALARYEYDNMYEQDASGKYVNQYVNDYYQNPVGLFCPIPSLIVGRYIPPHTNKSQRNLFEEYNQLMDDMENETDPAKREALFIKAFKYIIDESNKGISFLDDPYLYSLLYLRGNLFLNTYSADPNNGYILAFSGGEDGGQDFAARIVYASSNPFKYPETVATRAFARTIERIRRCCKKLY